MSSITTNIDLVLAQLEQGEIVAIPTETVYGLAANAENDEAIRKVFAMKNRPLNHPLIMHVAKRADLTQWTSFIPDYAKRLMEHFWPGPLTLLFSSKKKQLNPLITAGQDTIAIRCPAHPLAQTILERLNFPLVAPSANPFGKISPTTAQHVQASFENQSLLILDGGRCTIGIESTIIDATNPEGYEILRHGLIEESQISRFVSVSPIKSDKSIQVPGKLERHYQPEKPLYFFKSSLALENFIKQRKSKVYVLSFTEITPKDLIGYFHFSSSAEQTAFELYYQLRRADESNAQYLAIELPPLDEDWNAVRERILKAGILGP